MTLTEQWKKGELPDGMYYMENTSGIIGRVGHSKVFPCYNVKQILAPVPSYEEWKALMDLYKEADVIIKKSDKENIKLKTDCKTLAQKLLQVKPELRDWLEVNYGEYL